MPLADRGRVIGFVGFEAAQSEWTFSVNHVMTLRSAAGILAQAFAKRTAEERLAFQASHDPLTGLPNRWSFQEALRAGVDVLAKSRDRREAFDGDDTGLAVLLFDVDRFKVINDSLGHRLGDQLLVILARRMEAARPAGTVWPGWAATSWWCWWRGCDSPTRPWPWPTTCVTWCGRR